MGYDASGGMDHVLHLFVGSGDDAGVVVAGVAGAEASKEVQISLAVAIIDVDILGPSSGHVGPVLGEAGGEELVQSSI
jgi:hypothetical protein